MVSSVKVRLHRSVNELLHATTCVFYTACKTQSVLFASCLESSILGCRETSFPSLAVWLVRFVSHQMWMSVRCPPRAPRGRVQTRRVPSCVSHVSLVLRCLRMDSSVKVRLSAVFVQKWAFVVPNRCVFVWLPSLEIAHEGECAAVNGIRCKRYDLKAHAPPLLIWAQNPKIPLPDITS